MSNASNFALSLSLPAARALAIFVAVAVPGAYLADALFAEAPKAVGVSLGLLKIAGLLGAVALFLSAWGQQSQAPDGQLDERQRAERDRAYVRTHQLMVGTLFLALFYTVPARLLGWWMPNAEDAVDLLSAFAITGMALPGMILAWRDEEVSDD